MRAWQSIAGAMYWYEKAANAGNTFAMRQCAEVLSMSVLSFGLDPNDDEKRRWGRIEKAAEAWTEKAAQAGDVRAMTQLAFSNEPAEVFEKAGNPKLAFYWHSKAAESGLPVELANLARCWRDGIGCSNNDQQAKLLFDRAVRAARGDAEVLAMIDNIRNQKNDNRRTPKDGENSVQANKSPGPRLEPRGGPRTLRKVGPITRWVAGRSNTAAPERSSRDRFDVPRPSGPPPSRPRPEAQGCSRTCCSGLRSDAASWSTASASAESSARPGCTGPRWRR